MSWSLYNLVWKVFFGTQAVKDPGCAQCPQFVVESASNSLTSAYAVLKDVNVILLGKTPETFCAQLESMMANPAELKTYGSLLQDSLKTLQKMLKVIADAKK